MKAKWLIALLAARPLTNQFYAGNGGNVVLNQ